MSEHILLSRNEYYDLLHKKRKAESDLLSARQTIAEQAKRIKELEAERGEKKPNYDPDDFRVGKG